MSQNAHISEPGKVSEMQTLTDHAQRLSNDVDQWNDWYVWGAAFALLVAFFVFWSQFRIIRKGRELSSVQADLIAVKDRQLQTDLAEKDHQLESVRQESKEKTDILELKAKEADGNIAAAKRDAANAAERAASANRAAEQERLARVKLEAEIAPRRLSEKEQRDVAIAFQNIHASRVRVISYSLDAEGAALATQILFCLDGVKVPTIDGRASFSPLGGFAFGIHVSGSNVKAASAVRTILREQGHLIVADGNEEPQMSGMVLSSDPLPEDVQILVAVKPLK